MRYKLLAFLALLALSAPVPALAQASLSTTTCPGAGCTTITVSGMGTLGIQVTGTFVGTLTVTGTLDQTNFGSTISVYPFASAVSQTGITATGIFTVPVAGLNQIKIAFTAYTSGTAAVTAIGATAKYLNIGPFITTSVVTADGTVAAPAWTWQNDTASGRYRIGTNNYGESIAGTIVYDWNATRLNLASGYNLVLAGTGQVQAPSGAFATPSIVGASFTTNGLFFGSGITGLSATAVEVAAADESGSEGQFTLQTPIAFSSSANGHGNNPDVYIRRLGINQIGFTARSNATPGFAIDFATDGTAKFLTRGLATGSIVQGGIFNAITGAQINGAATTGTIFRGNGTNYVASTNTFPDTAATGALLVASATNVISAKTPGSVNALPANQTGNATATLKMNGLGAAAAPCIITPAMSGRVSFTISGQAVQSTTADGITLLMTYGTGGAPANAATATGTALMAQVTHTALTGQLEDFFSFTGLATGLGLVATWFDLQIAEVTGGTASVTNVTCSAFEF